MRFLPVHMIVMALILSIPFTKTDKPAPAVQKQEISSNQVASQLAEEPDITLIGTVKSLKKIKTDWMDTYIPPAAKPLLTKLKHQLRDLILHALNAQNIERVDPHTLQRIILAE